MRKILSQKTSKILYKVFFNDQIIMFAIIINIVILFLLSFDEVKQYVEVLEYLDSILTIFFFVEMIVKIRFFGWKDYISKGWNKLDFVIVLLTMPSLIFLFFGIKDWSFLLVLRAARVSKFFRFLKFIPNLQEILSGVGRAIKASVFVIIAFFLYNIIVSLFTCYLFKELSHEHFGNAFISFYSIFKMFTLEGWYEIPEEVAKASHGSTGIIFFIRFYFLLIVITGGVFGISIVNAIFVDEMISDNNNELEERITKLENKISRLIDILEEKEVKKE